MNIENEKLMCEDINILMNKIKYYSDISDLAGDKVNSELLYSFYVVLNNIVYRYTDYKIVLNEISKKET